MAKTWRRVVVKIGEVVADDAEVVVVAVVDEQRTRRDASK